MSEHKQLVTLLNTIQAQNIAIIQRLDSFAKGGIMTRKEICEEFNISPPTIHTAMRQGKLKFHKIGRLTRFRREDVERWLTG